MRHVPFFDIKKVCTVVLWTVTLTICHLFIKKNKILNVYYLSNKELSQNCNWKKKRNGVLLSGKT